MLEGKPEKRGRPAFSLAALSAALLSLLALVLLVLFVRNELGWTAIAVATLSAAGLGVALWMDRARTLEGESRERERVEVERALAESRLYGILEGTSDVIVAWDQEFRCIAANSTWRSEFEQLTGARPEIGMNIVEALSAMPEQQERAASLCRRVLCGEAFTITMETTGDRHFEVSYFPVRDEHGRLIGGGHIARDVTARVRAEEEVRSMNDGLGHLVEERTVQLEALLRSERAAREEALRANRLKDEFLAMLSHELRTPLTAILGWAQYVKRPECSREDIGRGLEIIERNARLQTQIISDLLDMSRITTGKLSLDMGPVDLQRVVEAALESVRYAAQAKGIELRTTIGAGNLTVSGDAARLQQVVWNLVSNAVKFTPKGGRVEVGLARGVDSVQIRVTDSGEGIEPGLVPCLFERFRQGDSSLTRSHGGLGLGLSIVKSLVDLHGGTVRGESEGPGRGATFTVELPCLSAGPPVGAEETQPRTAALRGLKVLVVDDEPDTLELIRRVLEEQSAQVITAGSAREALDALGAHAPDVLVSDIGMPEKDGYALIREIRDREQQDAAALPAVALTAFARAEDRERALRAGFQAHLIKPIEPRKLVDAINTLRRPRERGGPALCC